MRTSKQGGVMANPIVDFEQIAQNLLHAVTQAGGDERPVAATELIVEQLRHVWNGARRRQHGQGRTRTLCADGRGGGWAVL
jgi:hypothetical protein